MSKQLPANVRLECLCEILCHPAPPTAKSNYHASVLLEARALSTQFGLPLPDHLATLAFPTTPALPTTPLRLRFSPRPPVSGGSGRKAIPRVPVDLRIFWQVSSSSRHWVEWS